MRTTLFLGTLTLIVNIAGGVEASDLARCAAVEDDTQRLACYDRLAAETAAKKGEKDIAGADKEVAERNRIISRCREDFGEYGSTMVKACADRDIRAYQALRLYSAELRPFVDRCVSDMGEYGWAMVKACADRDIDAERALNEMMAE